MANHENARSNPEILARLEANHMTPSIPKHVPGMTVVAGQVIAPGTGALMVSVDRLFAEDEPNSILTWLDSGTMKSSAAEWNACAVAVRQSKTAPTALYVGEDGYLTQFDGQVFHELAPIAAVADIGPLRCVRDIGSRFTLAAGTALQVYRSIDWATWKREEIPLLAGEALIDLSVESIAAFSEDEVYAVGWQGLLCVRDGRDWRRIDSPTDLDLHDVVCGGDGLVYAVGTDGTILKGRGDSWSLISQKTTTETLWGVASFDGRVFICSMHMLYELRENELVLVSPPDDVHFPSYFYRLSAATNALWSLGSKELCELRGDDGWHTLLDFTDR